MDNMTIKKLQIERLTVTSSKPLESVVAALKAAVGQPDIAEFIKEPRGARTFSDLERAVQKGLSPAGLMLFMELDQGGVLRKETGLAKPKIVRLLIGNPLIMKEMARHVPYDTMASLLATYANSDALAVARDLD